MAYYGVFLDLTGRSCRVVGGGEIAERKVEGLLRAGGEVMVIADPVTPGLEALAERGTIELRARGFRPGDLAGAFLVIAATGHPETDRVLAEEAGREHALVNVVDVPELCSFIAPAILERGELQIAVSTSGAAPGLAAALRDRIAANVGPEFGPALRILRRVRESLRVGGRSVEERQQIVTRLAASDLPDRVRRKDRAAIDRLLSEIVEAGTSLDGLGLSLD